MAYGIKGTLTLYPLMRRTSPCAMKAKSDCLFSCINFRENSPCNRIQTLLPATAHFHAWSFFGAVVLFYGTSGCAGEGEQSWLSPLIYKAPTTSLMKSRYPVRSRRHYTWRRRAQNRRRLRPLCRPSRRYSLIGWSPPSPVTYASNRARITRSF